MKGDSRNVQVGHAIHNTRHLLRTEYSPDRIQNDVALAA